VILKLKPCKVEVYAILIKNLHLLTLQSLWANLWEFGHVISFGRCGDRRR